MTGNTPSGEPRVDTTRFFYFKQDLFKYLFPYGVPRNSFIILAGEGGTGKSVILAHIVKDFLASNEPVIYVTLDDDTETVIKQLEVFGVNAKSMCEEKKLIVIDGFSFLMPIKRQHICIEEEVIPESPEKLLSPLNRVIDKYGVKNTGLLAIDSLSDILMLLEPTHVVMFIKALRAGFAKARNILTVATLHTSTTSLREYLLSIEHLVDGVLETSDIPEALAQQIPLFVKQITVRKLKGTTSKQGPVLYGIDTEGLKPVILKFTK